MTQGFAIHPVIGSGYCGPTIIAAVTGRSITEVEQAINQWRRSRPADSRHNRADWKNGRVIGTYADEVEGTLNLFGFSMQSVVTQTTRPVEASYARPYETRRRYTFTQWLRKRPFALRKATLLVSVHTAKSGHWVLVRGQTVLDSMTSLTPVDVKRSHNKLWKVYGVWEIKAPALPISARRKAPRTGSCYCGCGAMTKSLFAPGHDAKLKGTLRRVLAREATMEAVPESTRRALSEFTLVGFRIDNGLLQEV